MVLLVVVVVLCFHIRTNMLEVAFGYCMPLPRKPVSQLEVLRAMEHLADA